VTSGLLRRCEGMADEDEERFARPDGHRYDAPESDERRTNKEWNYAALGLLVVVLMVLIATGTVQVFPGG
jgi:hypothetical protein